MDLHSGAAMSEPIIGACAKHGRNLASCEECFRDRKRSARVVWWEHLGRIEVEHLRANGQLRIRCQICKGNGVSCGRRSLYEFRESYPEYDLVPFECTNCEGTGWEWST